MPPPKASSKLTVSRAAGALSLAIEGRVDETTDFASVDLAGVSKITLALDETTAFTSFGVKRWIELFGRIPAGTSVALTGCSVAVVHQINSVAHFFAGADATIVSYYVPYYCEPCDRSFRFLVETGSGDEARFCESCKGGLQPDAPLQYAAFQRRVAGA